MTSFIHQFKKNSDGYLTTSAVSGSSNNNASYIQIADGAGTDAFGRLRVSNNHILLSSQLTYDLLPLVWDTKITGIGTVTHLPNESAANLSIGTADGNRIIRQTKRYWLYRAGQSQSIDVTFSDGYQIENVEKRVGYFDDNNGIFLEITENNIYLVIRTNTSGIVSENRIQQTDWNLDVMDGTGPSGFILNIEKAQILHIDFQWLGVGGVRIGFNIDRQLIYVHEFLHANDISTVYMSTAALPVRYEIENVGISAGANFKQICSSVVREGGSEEEGVLSAVTTPIDGYNVGTTAVSLLTIRLRSSHVRGFIKPLYINFLNLGNQYTKFSILLNPTLTGTLIWGNTGQTVQRSYTNLPYVDGTGHLLGANIVEGGGQRDVSGINLSSILGIASNIDGDSDIISIVAESSASTNSVFATIQFLELY